MDKAEGIATTDDPPFWPKPPFWEDELPLLRHLCTPEECAFVLQWIRENRRCDKKDWEIEAKS